MKKFTWGLSSALFVVSSHCALAEEPTPALPTVPAQGTVLTYVLTSARGQRMREPLMMTVTYTQIDNANVTLSRTTDRYTESLTYSRADPVFLPTREERKFRDEAQGSELAETAIREDPSFPLTNGKEFHLKGTRTVTDARNGTPQTVTVDFDRTCSVGPSEQLSVAAGNFEIVKVECSTEQAGGKGTVEFDYAPKLGVNVRTVHHRPLGDGRREVLTVLELRDYPHPSVP